MNTVIKVEDSSVHRGPLIYKRLTGLCGAINNIYTYKEVHTNTHSSSIHSFVEFCKPASVERAHGLHLDCVYICAMNRDLEEEYHGIAHCAEARFMQDAGLVIKVEDASPNHGTTVHERLTALCGEIHETYVYRRDFELSGVTTHSFIKFKEARGVMRACALCLEGVTIRALTPALEKQYRDVVREAPFSTKEACNTSIRSSSWVRAPASAQITETHDQHNTRLRKRSSQGTPAGSVPAPTQRQDCGLANLPSKDLRSGVSVRAVCTSEQQDIQDAFHESCGPIRHINQSKAVSPPPNNDPHSFAEFKDSSLEDVEIQSVGCDSPGLKESFLHAVSNNSTVKPSLTVQMSKTTSLSQPPIFPWKLPASSSSNARQSMSAPANGSASAPATNSFPWASVVPIPAPERSAFVLSKQPPPKIEEHKMHKIPKGFRKTADVIQPGFIIPDAAQDTMHAIADARATVTELSQATAKRMRLERTSDYKIQSDKREKTAVDHVGDCSINENANTGKELGWTVPRALTHPQTNKFRDDVFELLSHDFQAFGTLPVSPVVPTSPSAVPASMLAYGSSILPVSSSASKNTDLTSRFRQMTMVPCSVTSSSTTSVSEPTGKKASTKVTYPSLWTPAARISTATSTHTSLLACPMSMPASTAGWTPSQSTDALPWTSIGSAFSLPRSPLASNLADPVEMALVKSKQNMTADDSAPQSTIFDSSEATATLVKFGDRLDFDYLEVQRAIDTESVFQSISPGAVNHSCGAITKSKDGSHSEARRKKIKGACIYGHTGKENMYKTGMKRKVVAADGQALEHGSVLHSELPEEERNMQLVYPESQPLSTPQSLTSATILLKKASTPRRNSSEVQHLKLEPEPTPTPNCLIPATVPLSRPAFVSPFASVPVATSIPIMQSESSNLSGSTQFTVIQTTTRTSFTLQTNLTLAIYGEVVNYDLNTLDPEPRTIIEMLKMSASERDKWMVIGCYYMNKGMPEAAIKVVQTMIRVMRGRGMQDADLKPAFLLLFNCETLLCKMVLAKESRRTECSDGHARKALEWLRKIYNDVNLPLSSAEQEANAMRSMPSPKLTSLARHTVDSMGPMPAIPPPTSPTAFLSHLQQLEEELKQLREDKHNLTEELSTVCAAKRLLEEDTNVERNVRRRLERELCVEHHGRWPARYR
ncbi:hypothetical protein HWV62_22986 [Athelia sp. TMB]|nr:hypothetical protein HWV62_22986 [Athelia sp. TMB]